MRKTGFISVLILAIICGNYFSSAQDTLRVMAYNVLEYGEYPLCQGPDSFYNAYLETIVQYANPDIVGLEKLGSLEINPTVHDFTAAPGFQDSILQFALNAAYPGRFNYCMNTNTAASNTEPLLFYNQQKLGYDGITCSYSSTEDFNTYKLYYLDPNLSTTHDTTFLYVTLNHDISGSGSAAARGAQIAGEMAQIQTHFTHLGNMLSMGDFNVRNSSEPVYQTLTNPADTDFRYYDPPFYPDGALAYPADWDGSPTPFSAYLTTSTRSTEPNSCASAVVGGGKDWYDHIFISPWIAENADFIHYIPHSYKTLGNDGHRLGIGVNDAPTNTAVPANVANALYQMSDKYPVMVSLLVTPNTTGTGPGNPEITGVKNIALSSGHVSVVNPVAGELTLNFSSGLLGKTVSFSCVDMLGRSRINATLLVTNTTMTVPGNLEPGVYAIRVLNDNEIVCQAVVTKY